MTKRDPTKIFPSVDEVRELQELFRHQIESFDYLVGTGLENIMFNIKPVKVHDSSTNLSLRIWLDKPEVFPPQKPSGKSMRENLLPSECRQAKMSYTGKFTAEVCFQYDDGPVIREKIGFGQFPIMIKSKLCNLRGAEPKTLVSLREEATEMGGYFILNGLERVVRLVILPKRNYPTSMIRGSFCDRQEGYTDKAVVIRCEREDQSSVTVKLYYIRTGSARLGFWIRGREFLLPVGIVFKALINTTDHEIYESLTSSSSGKNGDEKGVVGTEIIGERAHIILNELRELSLLTREQCLEHIGEHFQHVIGRENKESYSDVARTVLKDYVFVHLNDNYDKFNLLIFMMQKLFSLVDQTSVVDNPDSLQNQDVLLPGHLLAIYVKEKMEEWLRKFKELLEEQLLKENNTMDFCNLVSVKKVMDKNPPKQITSAIENLLKTGRVVTESGLDLQQRAGFSVQADRLNYLRFISHFRAVHRGASFAGLRTTSVRKLLPESWGFLCPVHTPDGEPCGLLNHMTNSCRITSYFDSNGNARDFSKLRKIILSVLVEIGMSSSLPKLSQAGLPEALSVLLDGRVVGFMSSSVIEKAVAHLRRLKVSAVSGIPDDLEVGYVPLSLGGAYPGLYLFTSPARFVRPVKNLSVPSTEEKDTELIGPFEQVFMEIKCPDGGDGGRKQDFPATHEELNPTAMLSVVANLIPWSEYNQSPRNMYQCQMAKQTMGFSLQALSCRADQKLYHLQTPQHPIVRTKAYEKFKTDEYPIGTNAIVAVLSYTGYDMEDAMILNKSSVERGMFHGQIYQTETIDLSDQKNKSQSSFRRSNVDKSVQPFVDSDGLPYIGQTINPNDPFCSIYDELTGNVRTMKRKGSGPAVVDYVSVGAKNKNTIQKASIRFRQPRNPTIGDKFSSRHGQKGVCSQLWPDIDMPFSGVTGMRPDLIINPHAFPSRMTIAMLLESVAAKGGSLHGKVVDATPFSSVTKGDKKSRETSLVDELGEKLREKGFNYHGCEVLYSGVYGTELTCEIFIGPVYYQRLRHMVSDKFQVRSTGTVDQVTRQAIKGRKRGGGIRFGEMERDSMLAHGAAYLLHDRLHSCSDYHIADVCSICGSLLTTLAVQAQKRTARPIAGLPPVKLAKRVTCKFCGTNRGMETVAMPYVFRYLTAELASMNIRMNLRTSSSSSQ